MREIERLADAIARNRRRREKGFSPLKQPSERSSIIYNVCVVNGIPRSIVDFFAQKIALRASRKIPGWVVLCVLPIRGFKGCAANAALSR